MHYEYAVEPRVLGSNWQTFVYLIEKFGFDKGRLISQFPSNSWFSEVYDAASKFPPTQKARFEILMKQARRTKVIRKGRAYDPNLEWLPNALNEHQHLPFQAIIARENAAGSLGVLLAEEIDELHPLMVVKNPVSIPRDAVSIASALSILLENGSRILVIDPFFNPLSVKYKTALRECLQVVKAKNARAVCEIHYRYHENGSSPSDIEKIAAHVTTATLSCGMFIHAPF